MLVVVSKARQLRQQFSASPSALAMLLRTKYFVGLRLQTYGAPILPVILFTIWLAWREGCRRAYSKLVTAT